MTVVLIPFEKSHLAEMDMREHEKELLSSDEAMGKLVWIEAVSGYVDGVLTVCAGVTEEGTVWMIPCVNARRSSFTVARQTLSWLRDVAHRHGFSQMNTISLDDDLHNRWMAFLGFKSTLKLAKMMGGRDYRAWSISWV